MPAKESKTAEAKRRAIREYLHSLSVQERMDLALELGNEARGKTDQDRDIATPDE